MGPTLTDRAIAWQETSLPDLIQLEHNITLAFNSISDPHTSPDPLGIRSACEELLVREKLPGFYRAQLLVYKSATEKEGDYARIRERLEDAKHWITDLKASMVKNSVKGALEVEPEVVELERTIDEKLAEVNEKDPGSRLDGESFEEKLKRTEELREFDRASRMVGSSNGEAVLNGERIP